MTVITRPAVPEPQVWHFPQPEVIMLANGLTLWVFHLPGQHVIAADLVIDLPLSVEPRNREGVGLLCARVADEGTLRHPGAAITEELERRGAAYSAHVWHTATVCSLDVPSTRLADALPLFAEIVLEPAYAPTDVARHVALRRSEIAHTRASAPGSAAMARRSVQFLDDSRFSRAVGGTEDSIAGITAPDLHAFHDVHWRPDRATLVIAGDLPVDVVARLEAGFGSWAPAGHAGVPAAPDWRPATTTAGRRVVHLVDRPDAVQAEIRLCGRAIDRSDPRLSSLQVAATALGGSFLSRLNSVLREELGYTYGAHLGVAPMRSGGQWTASWSCRTEVTADALAHALDILALAEPLTREEVRDAVNYLVGVAPLRYDTAGGIAEQARSLAADAQDADYPNRHFARVAATTAEDATGLVRELIRPDDCWIVVVGAAAELSPALSAAGFDVSPLVV